MLVMGIDPGIARTGYGIIEADAGVYRPRDFGTINTVPGVPQGERLLCLFKSINSLFEDFLPQAVAVEQLYFYRNVTNALKVAEARGVILLAASCRGIPVSEYTPLQVKQAVVGYGRAAKQQVQAMICMQLGLQQTPIPDDAADALAVALCHLHSNRWRQWVGRKGFD